VARDESAKAARAAMAASLVEMKQVEEDHDSNRSVLLCVSGRVGTFVWYHRPGLCQMPVSIPI
jgi:hypothetical protein